ncbi:MAG: lipocalin-like domain-containing protein [Alphaproteobacteria bacterium]|nr:lipocalin-like domain-containing protein [Alphaproteobacteria bacterium]
MKASDLVGTWTLVRYETATPDGKVVLPMGADAFGRLTYTSDGYMHAYMCPASRSPFAGNDMYAGSEVERLAAADRFLAYCGPFEVQGDSVLHHAESCFFPNWVGQTLPRKAELQGDRLTLRAPTAKRNGVQGEARLIWQRLKRSS